MSSLLIRHEEHLTLGLDGSAGGLDQSPSRFRPPAVRNARWCPRPELVRRLERARSPLILLVAPAGYGKTALLTQWEQESDRPFAWVTLDQADGSPAHLIASVERALAVAEVEAVLGESFVLVLDNAQVVPASLLKAAMTEILGRLPRSSQLVVTSRNEPTLALGRMRAQHEVAVIDAAKLTMSDVEAGALLRDSGVGESSEQHDAIIQRCEGWPAALALAAGLWLEQSTAQADPSPLRGADRVISEYLQCEFLDHLPRATTRFLTQSSVLSSLSGPLCDEVLDRRGSATLLAGLSRGNLPLCPTDSRGERYRLHGLFREMLLSRLTASEPETARALHRRAATWYRRMGNLDLAVDHASSAEDARATADLLWTQLPHQLGNGRGELVQRWLSRFTPEQSAASAGLALATAYSNLATGRLVNAEDWARTAGVRLSEMPDDSTEPQQAAVLIVHAWAARSGIASMGEIARRSSELLPDDSPWQATCRLLRGTAALLGGDPPGAETLLQEGAARGTVLAPDAAALCLAQLAVLATDHESAGDLARRARAVVGEHGLSGRPASALVFAVSAATMMQEGLVDQANADASHCLVLLERLGDSPAWLGAETRILLARATLALGDVPGARKLLADASRQARRIPDGTIFNDWFEDAWDQFDQRAESVLAGVASLTTAELRVLRFLPTHYSFQEIAQRLHVSANTVKTHVHAVYRKLDASSRSEAVAHATGAGLLGS